MTRKYASASSERRHGLRKENVRFKFNYQRSFPEPLSQSLTNRFEVPLRAPTMNVPLRAPTMNVPLRAPTIEVPLRAPTIDVPLRARAVATPKI
jgi:hypothetical protein